jgi:hypothetical protein
VRGETEEVKFLVKDGARGDGERVVGRLEREADAVGGLVPEEFEHGARSCYEAGVLTRDR